MLDIHVALSQNFLCQKSVCSLRFPAVCTQAQRTHYILFHSDFPPKTLNAYIMFQRMLHASTTSSFSI